MTLEEAKLQIQEIKRLADLKAKKEKYEKKLKKVLTPEQRKAQQEELAAYEAKKAKMIGEYNNNITFRDDPFPITKFNYRVNNSTKEATMRITRNNQPLNLTIYENFMPKKLRFSKILEGSSQAGKLGIPPPPELTTFELPLVEKRSCRKRKRRVEVMYLSKRIFWMMGCRGTYLYLKE
ncbi:hypothetical protein Tco_1103372 [Tanacetum coccineum]